MTDSYSILIIEDEKNILDFMARTLDSLIISPVSKGLEIIKRKTNFNTISP